MPLLHQELNTKGPDMMASADDLKGRYFGVVDGNHRATALNSARMKASGKAPTRVRCAVLHSDIIMELMETGFLLNSLRSIQANDNFYDRAIWVRQYHRYDTFLLINTLLCICTYIYTRIYLDTVLAVQIQEYEDLESKGKKKARRRPSFMQTRFIKWCNEDVKSGPLCRKPGNAASLLIKSTWRSCRHYWVPLW